MGTDIRRESVGELFERHPGWASVLEEFGIDGRQGTTITLTAAADRVGVDVDDVVIALSGPAHGRWNCESIGRAPLRVLLDHIEHVHHRFLREELPKMADQIAAARRSRPHDAGLAEVEEAYGRFRAELELHLDSEESQLFPLCRDLADAFSWPSFHVGAIENPIEGLRHDHDHTAVLLADLAAAVNVVDGEEVLFAAIRSLDLDLRQHLTEETDLLFPAVLKVAAELKEP